MAGTFPAWKSAGLGQFSNAEAIDLSSTDYVPSSSAGVCLYVGGAGDIKVDMTGGDLGVTFKAAPLGILWIKVSKVYKIGTAATNLLGLR